MMDKENEKLISAFKQIDEMTEIETPSVKMITQRLEGYYVQKRAAYIKELILFICVACSLFVGGILLAFQAPVNVIFIQVVGFIAIPFIFIRDKKKIESEW